jgi:hypothetical protein
MFSHFLFLKLWLCFRYFLLKTLKIVDKLYTLKYLTTGIIVSKKTKNKKKNRKEKKGEKAKENKRKRF